MDTKERLQKYYFDNKDKLDNRVKNWFHNHLDRRAEFNRQNYEKNKIKVLCDLCDVYITKHNLDKHISTKKHQKKLI